MPGPPGPDLGGPLVQQGRTPVQAHQVGQRDVGPDSDRLAGPLRHQIGRDQPLHGFLERVVISLGLAAVVFLPARGGQRVQHLGHHRRALRRQVSRHDAGPAEGGFQPHRTVVERLVLVSTPFERQGWHPEMTAGMDAMGPGTADFLMQTPLYEAYRAVAPRVDFVQPPAGVTRRLLLKFSWKLTSGLVVRVPPRRLSALVLLVPLDPTPLTARWVCETDGAVVASGPRPWISAG